MPNKFISVFSNRYFTLSIKDDNTLWGWGFIAYTMRRSPVKLNDHNVWSAVYGMEDKNVILLKTNGTLWEWDNFKLKQISRESNWKSISCERHQSFGIKKNGTLWQWYINRTTPQRVGTDTNWNTVSSGLKHTIALKTDGTLWGWGDNSNRQLGLGKELEIPDPDPTQIGTDSDWAFVNCGYFHTLAIKKNGTLWGWGRNNESQLGFKPEYYNSKFVNAPKQIGISEYWKSASCGAYHSFGIKTNDSVLGWGSNTCNQLGIHSINSIVDIPTRLSVDIGWKSIICGPFTSFGIKNVNTLWGWGDNTNNQIKPNTTFNYTIAIPTQIKHKRVRNQSK
jgi:alpha-tubulin suppressor-like RCC1 family protein